MENQERERKNLSGKEKQCMECRKKEIQETDDFFKSPKMLEALRLLKDEIEKEQERKQ